MPLKKKVVHHTDRVNEEIARELMYILKDVKDPRVSKCLISITRTETTQDLKYCKIHYSVMNGDIKEVKAGIKSALGFIRRELSLRLKLRNTPELNFVFDEGLEHGARIAEILKNIE